MHIAVFFVGNRLMLDDGIGPATYDYLLENYNLNTGEPDGNGSTVDVFDVGCMTLDMVSKVNEYDLIITVDAVDGSDADPGTVFRYEPYDIARAAGARTSLHELKLADLFDAATMLGFNAEGLCFGMQVENLEPSDFIVGLTPKVEERLPFLAETVIAELVRRGCSIERKDGKPLNQFN